MSRRRRLQPPAAQRVRKGEDSASKWGTGRMNSDKAARAALSASKQGRGERGRMNLSESEQSARGGVECATWTVGSSTRIGSNTGCRSISAKPGCRQAHSSGAGKHQQSNRHHAIALSGYYRTSRPMSLSESLSRDVRESLSGAGEHPGRETPKPKTPEPTPQITTSQL